MDHADLCICAVGIYEKGREIPNCPQFTQAQKWDIRQGKMVAFEPPHKHSATKYGFRGEWKSGAMIETRHEGGDQDVFDNAGRTVLDGARRTRCDVWEAGRYCIVVFRGTAPTKPGNF